MSLEPLSGNLGERFLNVGTEGQVTFTVWGRKLKRTTEAEEDRHDTYDSFEVAKDFATELVERLGYYDARVINSKGVCVWEAKKNGVQRLKK